MLTESLLSQNPKDPIQQSLQIAINFIGISAHCKVKNINSMVKLLQMMLKKNQPVTIHWIYQLVNTSQEMRTNQEQFALLNMIQKTEKLSKYRNNANFIIVLLKLWNKGVKIDIQKIHEISYQSYLELSAIEDLNTTELEQLSKYKLMNHLQIALLRLVENVVLPMQENIITLKDDIETIEAMSDSNQFVHQMSQQYITNTKTLVELMEKLIEPCYQASISEFLLVHIVSWINQKYEDIYESKNPELHQSLSMDMALSVISNFLRIFKLQEDYHYSMGNIPLLILAKSLSNNKILTTNPHIRTDIISGLVYYIINLRESFKNSYLYNPVFVSGGVSSFVSFYNELSDLSDNVHHQKFNVRYYILTLILQSGYMGTQNNSLENMTIRDREKMIRFVYQTFDDCNTLLENGLSNLENIKQVEEDINNNQDDPISASNLGRQLEQLQKMSNSCFEMTDRILYFLMYTKRTLRRIYNAPEIRSKIVIFLNYNLNQLVGPDRKKYIIKSQDIRDKCGFSKDYYVMLLWKINDLYEFFFKNMDYCHEFAADGLLFSPKNLKSMRKILDKRGKLNRLSMNFEYCIDDIISIQQNKQRNTKPRIDLPDEFCDPIMSTPIEKPIILPNTKTIMDESVIKTHLLTQSTNPYTRELLTWDQLQEYNRTMEVKLIIADFNRRKRQWIKENW